MRTYDFETLHPRFNTRSRKWLEMKHYGVREEEKILPFSVADMEFVTAPEIVEALTSFVNQYALGYEECSASYHEAVCDWMMKRHGWNADSEWISASRGVVEALYEAVRLLSEPGDGVILLTPAYGPMFKAIRDQKRNVVECALLETEDSYEIDFEDFEKKAADPKTKLLMLCNPQNPTGRVFTKNELERLDIICRENGVFVISDESHFDLILPGYEHTVFAAVSPEAERNCIVCTSPGMGFNLGGMKIAGIFIPDTEVRERFRNSRKPAVSCGLLAYIAGETAYRRCGEWLDRAIEVIDENRRLIEEFLAKELPEIRVKRLEGTYLLWLDFRGLGLHPEELERINREEARLFFYEGSGYGPQGDGFERWNLACPTKYIMEALVRMRLVYRKYI